MKNFDPDAARYVQKDEEDEQHLSDLGAELYIFIDECKIAEHSTESQEPGQFNKLKKFALLEN